MKPQIVITILILVGLSAHAEPLKFKSWKEQQIVEAQNEVLRISARLRSQKNQSKIEKTEIELGGSNRFQRHSDLTDRDLKNAQESLEVAKEFDLQDYAEVYVSHLQNDPEQFSKLMASLTREEMTQLMKILVKNKPSEADGSSASDAKRSKASTTPTVAASASHL